MTYKKAGVDIQAGARFVEQIAPLARSTHRPEVLTGLGGFAGLFALRASRFKKPVLVSGTDGVGTKLMVAHMAGRHDTIGVDLVAMCVNDVVVTGAEPLFFLDYMASGKLKPSIAVPVVAGIAEGCRQAGCALIGGETAEMPSFYAEGQYDLAGFAVGVVEKSRIISGARIRPGDRLIGLASSGLHSNGYSLARKVLFEQGGHTIKTVLPGFSQPLSDILLTPTTIYVKTLLKFQEKVTLLGAAHITGGGMTHNLPRILPDGCAASVRLGSWEVPPIFEILKKEGKIAEAEMYADFNMGIGMIWVVRPNALKESLAYLKRLRQPADPIGEVVRGDRKVIYV
jgi:phosphoribosylformylglycinamidine cyclo-ligase